MRTEFLPHPPAALAAAALPEVEGLLLASSATRGHATQAILDYLAQTRGKRLRAQLVLVSAEAFGSEGEQHGGSASAGHDGRLVAVAAAVELVHLASLLHDDLIDGAAERRGLPTVARRWGAPTAVLAGDYLFAAAFELLVESGAAAALGPLSSALRAMSEAEIEELAMLFDPATDEEAYRRLILGKTASLFGAACQAGAEAGGAHPDTLPLARQFGLHLGLAFQIADDVQDLTGDPALLGKPTGQDLARGLITLPVVRLLREPEYGLALARLIAGRRVTPDETAWVRDAARRSGAFDYALAAASGELELALGSLACLPAACRPRAESILRPVASQVLARVR